MTRALVAGGTGAVGRALLPLLSCSGWEVHAWGRRRTDIAGVTDLVGQLHEVTLPAADVAFCALGTTRKQAGSEAAFRAIDQELVLSFARACHAAGVGTFVFVSSAGASATSPSFYLRVKGEVEQAIAGIGFRRVIVVRPSLLLDDRPGRPAEQVAVSLARCFAPVLTWLPARAIEVRTVAMAMVRLAESQDETKLWVVENPALHGMGVVDIGPSPPG